MYLNASFQDGAALGPLLIGSNLVASAIGPTSVAGQYVDWIQHVGAQRRS